MTLTAAAPGRGILLLGQNLFFLARVEMAAETVGRPVQQVRTLAEFRELYAAGTADLLLVDLEGDPAVWTAALTEIAELAAAPAAAPGLRLIAFGPHEDTATLERARALGCPEVLNKGRFTATLPQIVGGGTDHFPTP